MVDPDAPSRKNPRAAQWLHWILTNVEGGEEEETEDDSVFIADTFFFSVR